MISIFILFVETTLWEFLYFQDNEDIKVKLQRNKTCYV